MWICAAPTGLAPNGNSKPRAHAHGQCCIAAPRLKKRNKPRDYTPDRPRNLYCLVTRKSPRWASRVQVPVIVLPSTLPSIV